MDFCSLLSIFWELRCLVGRTAQLIKHCLRAEEIINLETRSQKINHQRRNNWNPNVPLVFGVVCRSVFVFRPILVIAFNKIVSRNRCRTKSVLVHLNVCNHDNSWWYKFYWFSFFCFQFYFRVNTSSGSLGIQRIFNVELNFTHQTLVNWFVKFVAVWKRAAQDHPPTHAHTMDEYDDDEVHTLTYNCIMAPNRCTKRFLNISDTIIALTVVTPLVVTTWWGTWTFMVNNADYFPVVPTFVLGLLWNLILVLVRHCMHEKVKTQKQLEKTRMQRCARYLIVKLFIYSFSISCIMVFRAIFELMEPYGERKLSILYGGKKHNRWIAYKVQTKKTLEISLHCISVLILLQTVIIFRPQSKWCFRLQHWLVWNPFGISSLRQWWSSRIAKKSHSGFQRDSKRNS